MKQLWWVLEGAGWALTFCTLIYGAVSIIQDIT